MDCTTKRFLFLTLFSILFAWGCSSKKESTTFPTPAPTYTISGTIYWAANNRVDSDVNDTKTTVSPQSNNSFAEAQPLPSPAVAGGYVNVAGQGESGRSFQDGDTSDFYTASLLDGDIVRLVLPDENDTDTAQVRLNLYDSDQTLLETINLANGGNDIIPIEADGDYYIEVRCLAGGTNYRLMVGAPLQISTAGPPSEFVPGEVLVKFRSPSNQNPPRIRAAFARSIGMQTAGGVGRWMHLRSEDMAATFKSLNIQGPPDSTGRLSDAAMRRARRRDTLRVVTALRQSPDVVYAQPNYIRHAAFTPNDEYYPYQWHYDLIHLPEAWDVTTGSSSVIVAVIDSGILSDHPDLAGKLVAGYDFVSDLTSAGDGNGIDNDPEDPGDNSGYHGTHVAGTIGAAFNNAVGVAGAGGATMIMPVRALGSDGGGTDADIVNAIRWAAGLTVTDANDNPVTAPAQRADIINMSLGGSDTSQILADAVVEARAAGVILVAAAGNDSIDAPTYPAAYAEVVSVGAVDAEAALAPYSNYGATISLVAPGGDMYTDVQPDGYGDGVLSTLGDDAGDPIYAFAQGTSMAAPHVSAVAALMKAINPAMTPDMFDNYIMTGDITSDLGAIGKDNLYGYGLIDAFQAVVAAGGTPSSAVILASPATLHIDAFTDSVQFFLRQIGSDSISLLSVASDENWLTALPSSGTAGFGQYTLSVNRSGLSGGIYAATVTVDSSANDIDVPVTIDVLPDTTGAAATQYLLLLRAANFSTVASLPIEPANGVYQFTFTDLQAGRYYLVCGSDLDNDGRVADQGEANGFYPSLNEDPIDLQSDQNGLRFITGFSNNTFTFPGEITLDADAEPLAN